MPQDILTEDYRPRDILSDDYKPRDILADEPEKPKDILSPAFNAAVQPIGTVAESARRILSPQGTADTLTGINEKLIKPFYEPIPLLEKGKEKLKSMVGANQKGILPAINRGIIDYTIPASPLDVGLTAAAFGEKPIAKAAQSAEDLIARKTAPKMPTEAPKPPVSAPIPEPAVKSPVEEFLSQQKTVPLEAHQEDIDNIYKMLEKPEQGANRGRSDSRGFDGFANGLGDTAANTRKTIEKMMDGEPLTPKEESALRYTIESKREYDLQGALKVRADKRAQAGAFHVDQPGDAIVPPYEQRGGGDVKGISESIPQIPGRFKQAMRDIHDFVTINATPKLAREGLSVPAAEHASARAAVPHMVNDLLAKVFPDAYKNPEIMSKTMDILNKDNILSGYDRFVALAKKAQSERDMDSFSKYSGMADKIAASHDLPTYDAEVRASRNDPQIRGDIARWKANVNTLLDQLYAEVKRVDPQLELDSRGKYYGARVNLLSEEGSKRWAEAVLDDTKPMPEPSASNYRNPDVSRDPFDRMAKFTNQYSKDAKAVLLNVLSPRWNEATKLRLYKAITDSGAGIEIKPGEAIPQDMVRLPIKVPQTLENGHTQRVERSLYVKPEIAKELREVLNTDMRTGQNHVAKMLTSIQLAQIADAVTHSKNLLSVVTRAQGAGSAWADITRKMPVFGSADAIARIASVSREVFSDTPAIRAEISEMAKLGMIRPKYPSTGLQRITKGQEFLLHVDTGARIVMNRFYTNLEQRGLVPKDLANRRAYVQQCGEYNARLSGTLSKMAKDSGMSPFLTAGRNFNKQGRLALTGDTGIKASSKGAAAQMRFTNLLGTGLLFTFPMMLNTLTTGNPSGRPGVPLGAWDLGTDDEKGKHQIIDLLQVTGIRRGMKSIGLDALIEGLRQGKNANQILGQAVQDAGNSVIHPWMGPAPAFVSKTLTGRQFDMRGQMTAKTVEKGGFAQYVENFRAALESQNPLVYSLVKPVFEGTQPTGEYGSGVAKTFLASPKSAFGIKSVAAPQTAVEAEIASTNRARMPAGFTAEQQAKYKMKGDLRALKKDNPSEFSEKVSEAWNKLSRKDIKDINKPEGEPLVEKTAKWNALDVAKLIKSANDKERPTLKLIFFKKLRREIKNVSQEDRDKMLETLKEINSL